MRTIDTISSRGAEITLIARRLRRDYLRRLLVVAARALAWWVRGMARRRSRLDLVALTDDQLRDIGLTPDAARREAMRPFWDGKGGY